MKSKTNPFHSSAISGAAIVFACFSMLNSSAKAADQLWTGNSGLNQNVDTASNWVGGAPSVDSWSPFVFGSDTVNGTVSLNRWVAISNITLTSGLTQDITMSGSPIVTGNGAVDMSSAVTNLTVDAPYRAAYGNITLNIGAGRTFTANQGVGEAVGWWDVAASLTKNGTGTAVINGASAYTLNTAINAGTLEIGGAGTLNGGSYTGTITNNGAFVHHRLGCRQRWRHYGQ